MSATYTVEVIVFYDLESSIHDMQFYMCVSVSAKKPNSHTTTYTDSQAELQPHK